MKIANYVSESYVDGPGIRFAVFTQGCPHRCPGCHNPETHSFEGGTELSPRELFQEAAKNPLLDGLTISGGEPFAQAEDCAELARLASESGLSVWVYTGYELEELLGSDDKHTASLLRYTDVLVDGPYVDDRRSLSFLWRGSLNQRLIDLKATLEKGAVVLYEPKPYI